MSEAQARAEPMIIASINAPAPKSARSSSIILEAYECRLAAAGDCWGVSQSEGELVPNINRQGVVLLGVDDIATDRHHKMMGIADIVDRADVECRVIRGATICWG